MLANLFDPKWWYMEIPRTGSSTLDRALFQVLPGAVSLYQKHWPILPTPFLDPNAPDVTGIVSIRNPYSRAVSCWQFFTKPGSISFRDWTRERLIQGFVNLQIEARPQSFWFNLHKWEAVIRQDHLVVKHCTFVLLLFSLFTYNTHLENKKNIKNPDQIIRNQ